MLLFHYFEEETTLRFSLNYLCQPTTIIYNAQVWLGLHLWNLIVVFSLGV